MKGESAQNSFYLDYGARLDFKAADFPRSMGHSFLSMVTARAVSIKAWFGSR